MVTLTQPKYTQFIYNT